ncbi:MAG TPA: alpha/beta fold hydrolase [Syntrophomonadaceae bacterium]|nr:alpha/beta fold hydrolase [Syntrophomonadaceae bacterium]
MYLNYLNSSYTIRKRYTDILKQLSSPYAYWSTPNFTIYEHQTLKLRHFPNTETKGKRPVLILPPQAGHHANIADYSEEQSLVRVFHRYGFDVYVTEWLSAPREFRNLGIADYIRLTNEAIEEIRRRTGLFKIHLVGECQGGWQAAIYTSLYPEKIASLVVAAAPIDVEASPSPMNEYAKLPMSFFRYLVSTSGGLMRGRYILTGFKNMQPEEHYLHKYNRLWKMLEEKDEAGIERFIRFENWYEYTQDLPGRFYLEIVQYIFKANALAKPNYIKLDGRPINLGNIDCPVVIMAGKKDHITPPEQAFSLKDLISTPENDIIEILTEGGHIGTLMGNEALRTNWTKVNEMLQMVI